MDDVLKSARTEDETIKLAKVAKAVCQNGGFNLWATQSEHHWLNPSRTQSRQRKEPRLGQDKLPIERALGVIWCIKSDTFNLGLNLRISLACGEASYPLSLRFHCCCSTCRKENFARHLSH